MSFLSRELDRELCRLSVIPKADEAHPRAHDKAFGRYLLVQFGILGSFKGQVIHQTFLTQDKRNNRILDANPGSDWFPISAT